MTQPTSDSRDPFGLSRFLAAQESTYEQALKEIRAGRKQTHWMWFVFPQLRGLGRSDMSHYYGLSDLEEARAYLEHETLGPRLLAITAAVVEHNGKTAESIFGQPDDQKLRSSATLFALLSEENSPFHQLLDQYFDGQKDQATLRLLRTQSDNH